MKITIEISLDGETPMVTAKAEPQAQAALDASNAGTVPDLAATPSLAADSATRAQIAGLVRAATAGGPAVLMGDFNLVERHPIYRQIAGAGLTDAFRAAGRGIGVTLPTRMARWAATGSRWGSIPLPPLVRVDYIWLTADLMPLVAWVGRHAGSDHLPVCVRLAHVGAPVDQPRPSAQPDERPRAVHWGPAALARG